MTTAPYEVTRDDVLGNIRAELARRRIPQARLVAELGHSQPYWSRRLNGEAEYSIGDLIDIAKVLGCSIGTLFGETTIRRPDGPDGGQVVDLTTRRARRDSNPQPSEPRTAQQHADVVTLPLHPMRTAAAA